MGKEQKIPVNTTEARYLSMRQFVNFYPPFSGFGELTPAIEQLAKNPAELMRTYGTYRSYIRRLEHLTETDHAILGKIQDQFPHHRGALHFIEKFGPERIHELRATLDKAIHPDTFTYPAAVTQLHDMMERAQTITNDPHDAPGTEEMIYGYRVIRDNPKSTYAHQNYADAQTHFVFCHFLERALFKAVSPLDPQVKWQKDDFLGALGDVMVLVDEQSRKLGEHHSSRPEYKIWCRSKEDGGLGWLKFDYINIAFTHMHEARMNRFAHPTTH